MAAETRRWIGFALLVTGLVVALRWPILGRSMIDWDESVYLLVASSVKDGSLPYVDVFSHKQPLLYVVLLPSFLVPDPIVGMRLIGCLAVASTAIGLGVMSRRLGGGWVGAWVAAVLYALAVTTSGGLATNTEILFAPFVTWAFALLTVPKGKPPNDGRVALTRFGLSGLLGGIAVQIKLVAGFELLALGLCAPLLWSTSSSDLGDRLWQAVRRGACFAGGLLVPLAGTLSVFGWFGRLAELWFANVGFNLAYTNLAVDRWSLLVTALKRQTEAGTLVLYAVSVGAAVWLIVRFWKARGSGLGAVAVVVVWYGSTVGSVLVAAKFYDHHFLQTVPAAVLLISIASGSAFTDRRRIARVGAAMLVAGLVFGLFAVASREIGRIAENPDYPRNVSSFLRDQGAQGSVIFVANSQPIIYLLSGARPPSRYVFPGWYVRPEFRRRLGIDLESFLRQVFEQRPEFVVMEQDHPWLPDRDLVQTLYREYLRGHYRPAARFGPILVFRRSNEGN